MKITFESCKGKMKGLVLAPVFEKEGVPERLKNDDAKGLIAKAMKADNFVGKKGQTCSVFLPDLRVILVGAGQREEANALSFQELGSKMASLAKSLKRETVLICTSGIKDVNLPGTNVAAEVAFGVGLGAYTFDVYKEKKEDDVTLEEVIVSCPDENAAEQAFEPLAAVLDGVYEARDLISEPANRMSPAEFVEVAQSVKIKGFKTDVLDAKQMKKSGMNLVLGVGQGAKEEPYTLIVKYMNGKKNDTPLLLVGKGVCFDSGGISLKPGKGMGDMKYDMAGAAGVLGTMISIAKLGVKANVVAVMPLVENMPSGCALKPGDVVQSMSGKTVEVQNTDAEGRLILADAVWYGQEKFKPDTVIDMATLTGAIHYSLGDEYAGLFTTDDELAKALETAGRETVADRLWRLPLHPNYDKLINSDIADISNLASTPDAGSSTAAHFIGRFIQPGVKWAHLDIASKAWTKKDIPCAPKGATGFGVQLLTRFILNTRVSK